MKKTDVIRGLKSELKDLEKTKIVGNIDYHRGKIDQVKLIIEEFDHIVDGSKKVKSKCKGNLNVCMDKYLIDNKESKECFDDGRICTVCGETYPLF